jgi:hypothetical protein
MDYRARYYDPRLGRFVSADTVVPEPGNPQAWNRYSYVLGSPLRFTDPSGHQCAEGDMPCWEARWYEAHGYSQEGGDWIFTGEHRFRDIDAIRELIEDTGQLTSPLSDGQLPNDSPLDAVGWRLEGSAGFIIGIDVNIDIIYNLDQQQLGYGPKEWELTPGDLDVFFSLGGQVLAFGFGASTGPEFIFNLPENDRLAGWGWNGGGTILPEAGGEGEVFGSISKEKYPEGNPWGFYFGGGAGDEISVYGGGGYTWNITEPLVDLSEWLSGQ